VLIPGALIVLEAYHSYGSIDAIMMSIAILCIFYRVSIIKFKIQGDILNHFINTINVTPNEISIVTLNVSAFLGIVKKIPISLSIKNEKIRFFKTNEKYGNFKINGTVYLIIYKNEKFAIAEKFFKDFESLIATIENYCEVQNR
jgi:hypothetical protein